MSDSFIQIMDMDHPSVVAWEPLLGLVFKGAVYLSNEALRKLQAYLRDHPSEVPSEVCLKDGHELPDNFPTYISPFVRDRDMYPPEQRDFLLDLWNEVSTI